MRGPNRGRHTVVDATRVVTATELPPPVATQDNATIMTDGRLEVWPSYALDEHEGGWILAFHNFDVM